MTNGQFHFFSQITSLKSNNARSIRSTPPIPWLYAEITAGCWIFCFPFPFIYLFALPIGCTLYALLPIVTTELSLHLKISMLSSFLKSKDLLLFFFFFFDINQRKLHYPIISHCASCPESLGCEVTYQRIAWKEVVEENTVIFRIFTNFQSILDNTCTQRFITTLIVLPW